MEPSDVVVNTNENAQNAPDISSAKTFSFKGNVKTFDLTGDDKNGGRRYISVNMTYKELRRFCRVEVFNPENGQGEQREQKLTKIRGMKRDMLENRYSPTTFYASVRDHHNVSIVNNKATIEVDNTQPLALIDGGHRLRALHDIKTEHPKKRAIVDNLSIPVIVYLDPDKATENFINLQAGTPVDKTHMTALKLQAGLFDQKDNERLKFAWNVAKMLNENVESPLMGFIRFDTTGIAPLAFNSLASKTQSDLATSLVGTAIIAMHYGKTPEWVCDVFIQVYNHMKNKNIVKFMKDGGTKTGLDIYMMTVNMMIYRLFVNQAERLTKFDFNRLDGAFDSATDGLDEVPTSFSFKQRRVFAGSLCDYLFQDFADDSSSVVGLHEGVPIGLIDLLSASTFNVTPLPKQTKQKGRKKKIVDNAGESKEKISLNSPKVVQKLDEPIADDYDSNVDVFGDENDSPENENDDEFLEKNDSDLDI